MRLLAAPESCICRTNDGKFAKTIFAYFVGFLLCYTEKKLSKKKLGNMAALLVVNGDGFASVNVWSKNELSRGAQCSASLMTLV